MKEIEGNFWDQKGSLFILPTNGSIKRNGHAVMGRGIAYQAANRFPGLAKLLGDKLNTFGNVPIDLGQWSTTTKSYNLMTLPTKHVWHDKSDLDLIEKGLIRLNRRADTSIIIPRLGCGNGGLDWETEVKPLMLRHLDHRYTIIHQRTKPAKGRLLRWKRSERF